MLPVGKVWLTLLLEFWELDLEDDMGRLVFCILIKNIDWTEATASMPARFKVSSSFINVFVHRWAHG